MSSTLIKRICDPTQMTETEKTSVIAEKGYGSDGDLKLGLHAVVGVAQEIHRGRLPAAAMLTWVTGAEYADALVMIDRIADGTFDISELWLILLLGERGIYTPEQIQTIWGI